MKVMFESGLVNWLGEQKFCADLDQALAAVRLRLGTEEKKTVATLLVTR